MSGLEENCPMDEHLALAAAERRDAHDPWTTREAVRGMTHPVPDLVNGRAEERLIESNWESRIDGRRSRQRGPDFCRSHAPRPRMKWHGKSRPWCMNIGDVESVERCWKMPS